MDRRTFLKFSAAAPAAAAFVSPVDVFAKNLRYFAGSEEAYWEHIRDEFPITKNIIFLNNGTMGPSPLAVTKAVTDRIAYVDATADYGYDHEALYKAIGGLLNADASDIALTHNVTEGISIVASGVRMMPGDEVLLTNEEHGGGAVPWLGRAKRHGIVVKFIELHSDDNVILERFEKAMTPRTKVIAVPHITCTTGHVLPVDRLSQLAHSKGAWMFVDGAHVPGMLVVDVKKIGCDAYASCGHKWVLGPKGTGYLYISKEFREYVPPSWCGAESDKHWDYQGNLEWADDAGRYDFATQSSSLYYGLTEAIKWQAAIGFAKIESRVLELSNHLREGLASLDKTKFSILTPPTSQSGITTIKLVNHNRYRDLAVMLEKSDKIRTRVVPEGDLEANRFSTHIYNSKGEIDTFISALGKALQSI
ncbi:MAG TPA: aminotransferase class V-fold PLP-dependent enzyme [Candidatus Kapabacteria bacterium]|nr:aminotransferase class V-fold PLP-dependent enzyme [Candidatus Kapabacteria bacterium]